MTSVRWRRRWWWWWSTIHGVQRFTSSKRKQVWIEDVLITVSKRVFVFVNLELFRSSAPCWKQELPSAFLHDQFFPVILKLIVCSTCKVVTSTCRVVCASIRRLLHSSGFTGPVDSVDFQKKTTLSWSVHIQDLAPGKLLPPTCQITLPSAGQASETQKDFDKKSQHQDIITLAPARPSINSQRSRIVTASSRHSLPVVYPPATH